MFINNKYTKWYYQIIDKAVIRQQVEGYSENHHIIPKSLGGDNSQNNLACLTAREHFICHWLLTKMVVGSSKKSMMWAFKAMANGSKNHKRDLTSLQYEINKKVFSKYISEATKGIPKTKSHRQALKGPRPHVNQTGINNNNHRWWITPHGCFASLRDAADILNVKSDTIYNLCVGYNSVEVKMLTQDRKTLGIKKGATPEHQGYGVHR